MNWCVCVGGGGVYLDLKESVSLALFNTTDSTSCCVFTLCINNRGGVCGGGGGGGE